MRELLLNFLLGAPPAPPPVPVRRETYVKRFTTICHWLAKYRFDTLDLAGREHCDIEGPIVLYANHPDFWDPIVCALICKALLPTHQVFAPIDAEALETHWYFRGLGFFGVDQNSVRGLRDFLTIGESILRNVERPCLILTPEGRFTDPAQRPVVFRKGLSVLLDRVRHLPAHPLALSYQYSETGKRTVSAYLGEATETEGLNRAQLHSALEQDMQRALDLNAQPDRRSQNILEDPQ